MCAKNFLKVGLLPLLLLVWLGASAVGQDAHGAAVSRLAATNTVTIKPTAGTATSTNTSAAGSYESVSFETLAAFPLKVNWLVNPTNATFNTLRVEGEIPAAIKSLHGKKVALHGYMKLLTQDARGVTEFLLMRDHALCCQAKVPQINEWVHVRMAGNSLPFAHERLFTVRGVLQVGELLGSGNVVSVYRLEGVELVMAEHP